MAFGFRASARGFGLLLCTPVACGLVDQSGADGSVRTQSRWLFLQEADALTLVELDDPRQPHLDAREPVAGSFWWSPDAASVLVLRDSQATPHLAEAPIWQPSPLPMPEVFDYAYFVGPEHFLGVRAVGHDGQEFVFRELEGAAVYRWGADATLLSISPSGAFAALQADELTLVRRDGTSVVLRGPGLRDLATQAFFDDAGEHVLIATWLEDAVDFGALPDFVAHVETERSSSCTSEESLCQPEIARPTRLEGSPMVAAKGIWSTSEGYAGRLFSVPLGEKTALPPPEGNAPHLLAEWNESSGDVWVDGPTWRVRLVHADADAQTWTVDERQALASGSEWERVAAGSGTFVRYVHVDFDLIWLSDERGFHALDLGSGRPPRAVGPSPPRLQGPQRPALFFEDDPAMPCERTCSYVAYADPSDPEAPVLRGAIDFYSRWCYQWAPDQSGLLLRSEGSLYYHAFEEPDVRFPLAPLAEETVVRAPPEW